MNKDSCLERQSVSGEAPAIGDVLAFVTTPQGGQWAPAPVGSLPGSGIGLDVIFRPGGVQAGNVYTTWTAAYTAATSTDPLQGPVTIGVDDSLAVANVDPGGWDMATAGHIVKLTTANPAGGATLNVPANAELINPTEIQGLLTVTLNSPVGGLISG